MPTRKRQGTWDQPGEKRQCVTEVAGERKRSPAAVIHDEGHGLQPIFAEEHSDCHHKGDGANAEAGEKHGTVFLLDVFFWNGGSDSSFYSTGWRGSWFGSCSGQKTNEGPNFQS